MRRAGLLAGNPDGLPCKGHHSPAEFRRAVTGRIGTGSRSREKEIPEDWSRYNAMSMLGEALCGEGKFTEAEPLLVEGYEKMAPPAQAAVRKREALGRVVKLYEAWGRPEKAAEWAARQR